MSDLRADAAYEAAKSRALRTTEALILAEGQILDLQRQLTEAQMTIAEFQEVNHAPDADQTDPAEQCAAD